MNELKDPKTLAKPECKRCNGTGWIEGKEFSDGSFYTSYPCSCTGFIVTD